MRAVDLYQLAWVSLRRNKLRSGLTAVGVMVGVLALTTIIALAQGLDVVIKEQLTDNESQTRILVRPGFGYVMKEDRQVTGVDDPVKRDRLQKAIRKRRRGGPGQMKRKLLTLDAIEAIRKREHVSSVRPLATDRFEIACGEHNLDGALSFGIQPDDARWNMRVIHGEPFAAKRGVWLHEYLLYTWGYKTDAQQATLIGKSVVLSRPRETTGLSSMLAAARASGLDVPEVDPATQKMAEAMLRNFAGRMKPPSDANAQGEELALEVPILGVVRERIEEDGFEVWEDSFTMQTDVFLPQAFAEELFVQVPSNVTRGYNLVAIEVDAPEHVEEVENALKKEGFRSISVDTILERVEQTLAVITTVVSGLTMIALLVAVLGIVNTMIMNVSERTREIGVLKALGATNNQIRALFLVESSLIGLAGGLTGIAAALVASVFGDMWHRSTVLEMTQYEFPGSVFSFPPWLLILAMSFAVGLSVIAALGPSTRASRVDPVTALRDE